MNMLDHPPHTHTPTLDAANIGCLRFWISLWFQYHKADWDKIALLLPEFRNLHQTTLTTENSASAFKVSICSF